MLFSHTHPQYELYFCAEGVRQKSVVNGVEYNYCYPCVIISSPFTVHSMSCDMSETSYERFVFNFSKRTLDSFDEHLIPKELYCRNSGLLFKLPDKEAKYLKDLLLLASPTTSEEKELTLALLLNKLFSFCPIENAINVGTTSFYIQDVLQYIAENYVEPLDAGTIAYKFLISRSKLDRDFKQFTGVTIHSFIEMCRLNQAKMLLELRQDLPISAISSLCGFTGDTYFFPFFKKNVGMTPIEYRKYLETKNQ